MKELPKTASAVLQFDTEHNFIQEFGSMSAAERELGISLSNIRKVCEGVRSTAGGYIWKYKTNHREVI